MDTTTSSDLRLIRRNMRLTRFIVILSFALNAGANVLLVGYFARIGGIDLVGIWAFLTAVALCVLVLDLGMVSALTFRIARDGLETVAPAIRRLVRLSTGFAFGLFALLLAGQIAQSAVVTAMALSALSAIMQLVANWMVSIRMGRQQHYWFNVKTILRVVVQTLSAVVVLHTFAFDSIVALGVALLLGGIAELAMAALLVRRELSISGPSASIRDLRALVAGFGVTDFSQRAYQPLSQLLVVNLLGTVAIGIFTVALRIPAVVGQSLNEGLRGLLPAIANLRATDKQGAVIELLRDSVALQITLVVPVTLFLTFHTEAVIGVWLGIIDPTIVTAVRIFSVAMVLIALGTPFHWAAQAGGCSQAIGRVGLVVLIGVLGGGALVMSMGADILVFVSLYAAGLAAHSIGAVVISGWQLGLLGAVAKAVQWRCAVLHLSGVALLNFALLQMTRDVGPLFALLVALGINAAVIGPVAHLSLKRKWI